jgi:NifB/MoaA-like Fe-S oxidoreductase
LTPVTPEFCQRTIHEVAAIQRDLRQRLGTTFAFLGDEIYLRAGRAVPSRKHYGDYPQIEDGIGMARSFANQFDSLMRSLIKERGALARPSAMARAVKGTILTGTLFAPVLAKMIARMNAAIGSQLQVLAVPNEYFGGDVSVAGLLTGKDFLAVRDQVRGDFAIIPSVALKSDEPIMLDGMRFEELQSGFNVPLYALDFPAFAAALRTGFNECGRKLAA